MPKRGPKRQRVRLPANSRTGSKSRACHFGAVEIDAGWPAKCIVLIGTGRRVLEQEKQVTNWINSGGHAPRRDIENNNCEPTGRHHRTGRWKIPFVIGSMLLALPLASGPGQARDPDGRYANSPLKQWFDSLKSGKGPCCSDADGSAVSDVDWESKGGHYRVRIEGEWHDVPEDAVITEPNRVGRTMVWPIKGYLGLSIRCFMPGSMT
jgi:hypothetical protein